jgi:hypothetical protein
MLKEDRKSDFKLDILGRTYTVKTLKREEHEDILKNSCGQTDWEDATIYLENFVDETHEDDENGMLTQNLGKALNDTFRHEIVHAFFYESGLCNEVDFTQNEALVDWIALQFPKMMKVMMQGKAFDDKEVKDAFAAYESVNRQA